MPRRFDFPVRPLTERPRGLEARAAARRDRIGEAVEGSAQTGPSERRAVGRPEGPDARELRLDRGRVGVEVLAVYTGRSHALTTGSRGRYRAPTLSTSPSQQTPQAAGDGARDQPVVRRVAHAEPSKRSRDQRADDGAHDGADEHTFYR